MLYYRALALGLDEMPAADAEVRTAIDADASRRGWPALHGELARIDAVAAARIRVNDGQRIQRALEVHRLTGRPMSSYQQGGSPPPFSIEGFTLVPEDRAELHARIAARFDAMLAAGLVEELRALRGRYGLEPGLPSMRAVGYRQAWQFLEGDISGNQLRQSAVAATRQLARRQLTWLRATPGLRPAAELAAALSRATG
jgi:tRNA dimethylallyltransferase